MIISVVEATHTRDGRGRVALACHGAASADEARHLAAAAYRVAAELETMAAREGLSYRVSACKAALGIVEVAFAGEWADPLIVDELMIEAASACGYEPTDMLVEAGEIEPTAGEVA